MFAIANDSFDSMLLEGENQSILISGESGAGKTEATKQCLNFLADAAGSDSNVEQKILLANPVLEAFGNAKTLRNNNSSRFGKWIEIHFDRQKRQIVGAKIINYLLEKSRVVRQQRNERNYHIFYQLCTNKALVRKYGLSTPGNHKYTSRSGCTRVRGINDSAEFEDVLKAMGELQFSSAEQDFVFSLTSGVLHLGDVEFADRAERGGNAGSQVKNIDAMRTAAKLLGVSSRDLERVLCYRSIEVRAKSRSYPQPGSGARRQRCAGKGDIRPPLRLASQKDQ